MSETTLVGDFKAKAVAARASVFEAADAIAAAGGEPSIITVQQRVGGSYTTIKRFLAMWQDRRTTSPAISTPPELATLGKEWLQRL